MDICVTSYAFQNCDEEVLTLLIFLGFIESANVSLFQIFSLGFHPHWMSYEDCSTSCFTVSLDICQFNVRLVAPCYKSDDVLDS